MKRTLKTTMMVLLCLAMVAGLAACGSNAADKAYKEWTEKSLPKVEQATTVMTEKATAANGDRDIVIAATTEYKSALESVADELAAIDMSGASANVKTAAEQHLTQLRAQIAELETSLTNAGAAGGGEEVPEEVPEEGDEEAPEEGYEEVPEEGDEEVPEEE